MKKNKTKERIWKEALTLFSKYGYEGVSVKAIASAVGIKDSSLYNHYKSKQEIFDTILLEATRQIEKAKNELTIPDTSDMADKYEVISLEVLSSMCYDLFDFYLKDDIVSKFRKMLTIEQYSSSNVSKLFNEIFIDSVLDYEAKLFSELIKKGHFIEGEPKIMALHFYSPLFLLLFKFDADLKESANVKKMINAHVRAFAQRYVKGGIGD